MNSKLLIDVSLYVSHLNIAIYVNVVQFINVDVSEEKIFR